jgi:regulator of protease activity HflC (stomatin/prohibitin superfamily)
MFNIGYFKGQPTDFIIRYSGGHVSAEGQGLAFFYLRHNTQIVAVPTQSQDAGFVFVEISRDFQEVTIQGQITFRVRDPKRAAELLNFRIDPKTLAYASDDPDRLGKRVSGLVQIETRAEIARRPLEEVLREGSALAVPVAERLRNGTELSALGVELLGVQFLAVRPTPEVAKALEADYREALLRKADEAVYARRGAAVDEERRIKEKELNADVALEDQRKGLIALQGANSLQEAEFRARVMEEDAKARAKAAEMQLAVFRSLDPRGLLAYAMHELGLNADKIGHLTITPDILAGLLSTDARHSG